MPSSRTNQRRGNRRNNVMQVRTDGDMQAARFDRVVSHFRTQQSTTTVLCKSSFDIVSSQTGQNVTADTTTVAGTDDFVSMAQQFNTFKIKAIRFEVFYVAAPGGPPIVMSTFHSVYDGSTPPTGIVNSAAIVDAPDSQVLIQGGGKQTFYWNALGTEENGFQNVADYSSHGGLRYSVPTTTANVLAANIIMTAQVVFRGRK